MSFCLPFLSQFLNLIHQSKLHSVVERLCLLARECVQLVVAAEGLLVKERPVRAEEGPLVGVDHLAQVVLDGKANVEELRDGIESFFIY